MVLERVFPTKWIEKHVFSSFILATCYSIISLVLARFIFPENTGIVSLVFLSLLLAPSLRNILREEEQAEEQETTFSLKQLYKDNQKLIKTYAGIFMGVFSTYFITTALLPILGIQSNIFVQEQLFVNPALAGRAWSGSGIFLDILANNWLVLAVAFLLALLIAEGAVFFIAWNASAWGAVFGYRALAASLNLQEPVITVALTLLVIVLPHTILEGTAYILATISGSVISTEAIKQSNQLPLFLRYATIAGFMYALFYQLTTQLPPAVRISLLIPLLIGTIYLLGNAFLGKKYKEVFIYNYYLFIIAVILFIIGVLIESYVLSSSTTLAEIYAASLL